MPVPSIADQLENASRELDRLIRDARLPPRRRHDEHYAELQARARAIAASIDAPFAHARRSAPPLHFETDGRKSSAIF